MQGNQLYSSERGSKTRQVRRRWSHLSKGERRERGRSSYLASVEVCGSGMRVRGGKAAEGVKVGFLGRGGSVDQGVMGRVDGAVNRREGEAGRGVQLVDLVHYCGIERRLRSGGCWVKQQQQQHGEDEENESEDKEDGDNDEIK